MTTAYSYVRFSSGRQRQGMSEDRQLESARRYAHHHSLILDTSTYKDLGCSAFRSKNVDGALGAFMEAVDAKKIPKGSYLLVESLDRLSRDTVDVALELFLSITRRGVVIVTLMDEQVYSSVTIKENWTKLIIAMAVMARANEESATKSRRSIAARDKRYKRGDYSAPHPPFWLEFDRGAVRGKLKPKPTDVVRRIYRLCLEGNGARAIARTLNAEKVPQWGNASEWSQVQVSRILASPAAYGAARIGTKTGSPIIIPNIYPAAIQKERWDRVQSIVRGRHTIRGSTLSNPDNIFGGLSFCAACNARMRFHPRKDNDRWYLKCTKHADGVGKPCFKKMFRFKDCEDALIYELGHRASTRVGGEFFSEQTDRRVELEKQVGAVKEQQAKLTKLALLSPDVEAVSDQLNALQAQLVALQAQLKEATVFPLTKQEWHENAALYSVYARLKGQRSGANPYGDTTRDLTEFRVKVKGILSRVLQRIEFFNADPRGWKPAMRIIYVNGENHPIWAGEK